MQNVQLCRECILVQDFKTGTLTFCLFYSQKYNLEWSNEEDDVEMTGEGSGEESRVDEDPFEKQMSLTNETSVNNSDPQQHQEMSNHRLSINWRSGSKKNLFLACLMTSSVRKKPLNIGMVVC